MEKKPAADNKKKKIWGILSCISVCLFSMTAVLMVILIYADGTGAGDEIIYSPDRVADYAPYMLIPLVLMTVCCILYGRYRERNKDIYGPVELNGMKKWKYGASARRRISVRRVVFVLLACVFIALMIIGILTGGMEYVLKKAITICSECIGLG